jgi:hypothetical protein
MADLTPEEEERKKAIFDGMSPRIKTRILKKGYEVWDPFMEPNDPIDLRKGKLNRTALDLTRAFLAAWSSSDYSNAFGEGAWEMCKGLIDEDDRFKGMYAFSVWYEKELEKSGKK